jgi:hypothetical protein
VKGSIDPLGHLTLWTRFGRTIVANLTTVANSARDFGVLLVGAWLAEEIAARTRTDQDLESFLKWESLVAFSRVAREPQTRLRGIERVRRRLADSASPLISAEKPEQILSNQKTYGLYGLFTVPSRRSALLEEGRFRLTPAAREFVEKEYVSKLDRLIPGGTDALVAMTSNESFKLHIDGKNSALVDAVSKVFAVKLTKNESTFFREWLLFAEHAEDAPVQRAAAELMLATIEDRGFVFGLKSVAQLASDAGRRFQHCDLEQRLLDVATCESVIGPAARLFSFALGRDGDSLTQIAGDISKVWRGGLTKTVRPDSFSKLPLAAILGNTLGGFWNEFAPALYSGHWEEALTLLLRINAAVMKERGGGAPWAEVENAKLKVRRADESSSLDAWKDVPGIWMHPYFLGSLRQVASDVGVAS